jgi:signal transduction histidine kinase
MYTYKDMLVLTSFKSYTDAERVTHEVGLINRSKQRTAKLARRLMLLWLIMLVACMSVAGYYLWVFLEDRHLSWRLFVVLQGSLLTLSIPPLWLSLRNRKLLSFRYQIFLMSWVSSAFWYWGVAPFYSYLTLQLDHQQLALIAFTYTWEVLVVAGFIFSIGILQYLHRDIVRYVQSGHSAHPQALYRTMSRIPVVVSSLVALCTIVGYSTSVVQLQKFAGLPELESIKDIADGAGMCLLLSMFYYFVFDYFLAPYRHRLAKQYRITGIRRQHFYVRINAALAFVIIACISLMLLTYIQSFQRVIRDQLVTESRQTLARIVRGDTPLTLHAQGASASADSPYNNIYYVSSRGELPIASVSEQTKRSFSTGSSDVIHDMYQHEKLIVSEPYQDGRLVQVRYPEQNYGLLPQLIRQLLLGFGFIFVITMAIMGVSSGMLTHAMRKLLRAVKVAELTGTYHDPMLRTNDEFETLSNSFGHFVAQSVVNAQQLRQEHARLQSSVNSLQQGLLLIDTKGNIIMRNRSTAEILQIPDNTRAKTLDDLLALLPETLAIKRYVTRSKNTHKPLHASNIAYSMKFLDLFITPIIDGDDILGSAIVLQDVTESQVLARSKDEFFSIASHELRTPLTVIRGNTSMMLDYYDKTLRKDPELINMVTDMHQASTGLIEIVNDFLDVSRLEQGKMNFSTESVAIDLIIESVVYEMGAVVKQKNISLTSNAKTLGVAPKVLADAGKVRQVLYNLVGNAVKFTDSGSVGVALSYDDRFVKVTVSDTGRGIPVENQKLLFRKFQQASNSILTRDTTRGTGLGLYISKLMVQKMGGKITLDHSELHKGSVFSFTLPIDANVK